MAFRPLERDGPPKDVLKNPDVVGEDGVALRRVIGLMPTVSFILGIIVGTGIFLTPAGVLRGTSGSIGIALVVWVVGAAISATGAVCYLELALYYRQSGGPYIYLSKFYGPVAGFAFVAVSLLVYSPCGSAIGSIVVVDFIITPLVGDCDPIPETAYKAGATCVLMLAMFVNSLSTKWPVKTQVFLTFVKVGALFLIIITGGVIVVMRGTQKFATPFATTGGTFEWSLLPSSFFAAFFTVGGWSFITNVVEEVKRPHRTLVRGMIISLTCTTTLYVLANLAYFAVLTPEEMMASDAVAALFAVHVFGVRWSFVIWFCVVLSAAGHLNGVTFTRSRVFFAAARANQAPSIISTIHVTKRTPLAAILFQMPLAIIFIWCTDVWGIINTVMVFTILIDIMVVLSVPYLRWKQPDRVLPYKSPLLASFTFLVFNVVLLVFTAYTNPMQMAFTAVITVVSLVGYYIYGLTGRSPRAAAVAKSANHFLQKLLLSVEPEAATF